MVWCTNCAKSVRGVRPDDSSLCCESCGKVLETDNFSNEPTFVKNSSGQSQLSGSYVRTVQSDSSLSRDRTMSRVHGEMSSMWHALTHDQYEHIVDQAMRFYLIALDRNFTKGRKTQLVQAACLYIACRDKEKPYLLIDFSHHLRTNVYVLGAVFLQLCRVLNLEESHIVQKIVDPSLFMTKFTAGLLEKRNAKVSEVALNIIKRMKRDWMQTGRKPSGICGAALYIAAKGEGLKCSKSDITKVVHICDATLTKRLVEFENTESASLTIEELNIEAKEYNECMPAQISDLGSKESGMQELLCVHKNDKYCQHFASGLCKNCYEKFIELSGGLGGEDPPAFQRAERERIAKAFAKEDAHHSSLEKETDSLDKCETERLSCPEPDCSGAAGDQMEVNKGDYDNPRQDDSNIACDESETLSDIDDLEVDGYLHNEEEKHFKKIIWENMNREYVEEQAAKEAAAAAAKEASDANCSESTIEARELVSTVMAASAKARKERQQKRAEEAKSFGPAHSAAEATHQMLVKKGMIPRVDVDKLNNLFSESVSSDGLKRKRIEPNSVDEDKQVADEELVSKDQLEEFEEENDGDPGEADYDEVEEEPCDYDEDEYGLY